MGMKAIAISLASVFLLSTVAAVGAESLVKEKQELYRRGECSWAGVLEAQETALLHDLLGAPLPVAEESTNDELMNFMKEQYAQGLISVAEMHQARQKWSDAVHIAGELHALQPQPAEKLSALRKNLEEQLHLARTVAEQLGNGNSAECILLKAKLNLWFKQ